MLLLVNKTKFASLSAAGQAQLVKHAKAYEKNGGRSGVRQGHTRR